MTTTSIIFERNVEGVMRDGVVLRADVWRPDKPGRFPVLLTRTPYDKTHPRISLTASLDPRRVVPHDYVMIFQDTRGRFASDGDPNDIVRGSCRRRLRHGGVGGRPAVQRRQRRDVRHLVHGA